MYLLSRYSLGLLLLALSCLLGLPSGAIAQSADELDRYIAEMKRRIQDDREPPEARLQLALATAATLGRAAATAASVEDQVHRWHEASDLLDQVAQKHAAHPLSASCRLQSAHAIWAIARLRAEQYMLSPTNQTVREEANRLLEDASNRFSSLVSLPDQKLGPEARLSQVKTTLERADLLDTHHPARPPLEAQASAQLGDPAALPAELLDRAHLLQADILLRQKNFTAALSTIDQIQNPAADQLDVKLRTLASLGRAAQALEALDKASLDPVTRAVLLVRMYLAQRRGLPPGPARSLAEAQALQHARDLPNNPRADAQLALIDLAKSVDEPDPSLSPEDCELLARGLIPSGDFQGSAKRLLIGADRAQNLGQDQSADSLRYQAAAVLYRGGGIPAAIAILDNILKERPASSIAPKSALLLAALQFHSEKNPEAYRQSLQLVIDRFPATPEASEARWLLGLSLAQVAREEEAQALWKQIPATHPRGLSATLATARSIRQNAELQGVPDGTVLLNSALAYLSSEAAKFMDTSSLNEIELERVRLLLSPLVQDFAPADESLAALNSRALTPEQRDTSRGFQSALALRRQRYPEAEALASAPASSPPSQRAMLEPSRLVDALALAADSDLSRRRHGSALESLALQLIPPEVPGKENSLDSLLAEAFLLKARGLYNKGDSAAAVSLLSSYRWNPQALPPELAAKLAETRHWLGDDGQAAREYNLLARRLPSGSPLWFQARYGLARSLAQSGDKESAQRLIEATSVIFPELGGETSRSRFKTLEKQLLLPR